ncbi:MAG: Zn-ribbon domain-containing OB-fold protein [Acidimicrobiia bacterium]
MTDTTAEYAGPIPVPDALTAGFWEHTSRHELAFQRCRQCGRFSHLPVVVCPRCENRDPAKFAYETVSGRGTIVNWTVIRDQMVVGFEDAGPLTHVLVRLDEDDDLMYPATLVGDLDGLALDAPVHVVFRDVTDEITIPYWELDRAGA